MRDAVTPLTAGVGLGPRPWRNALPLQLLALGLMRARPTVEWADALLAVCAPTPDPAWARLLRVSARVSGSYGQSESLTRRRWTRSVAPARTTSTEKTVTAPAAASVQLKLRFGGMAAAALELPPPGASVSVTNREL
jgi:hypothetical protein